MNGSTTRRRERTSQARAFELASRFMGRAWRPTRRAASSPGRLGVGTVTAALLLGSLAHAAPGPSAPELSVSRSRALALSPRLSRGGRVEQRELALHGLPVRGAYETVRVLGDGSEQVLSSSRPTVAPQLRPSDARIPAADVAGLVAADRGLWQEPELEGPPTLVYLMILGHPVLAWETQLALTFRPEPSRPTVWVSAATGRVLLEREQVRASRARVFPENPSKTPVPVEVELFDIDVEDAGHPLVGPRVQAFNCTGQEPDEVSPWWDEDECYPVQTVFSNEDGDFDVPTPDVVRVEDNIDPDDPYAELSMYVHAERFFEAMRVKGVEQFKCELSSMLANFRTLEPSTSFDYTPLNNAYYTNQCDPEKGPTMLFGQGSSVDFGYDGDVVYHELGHGMVALLAPDNLGARRLRGDASLVDSAALNESLADYFSIMLTDDPELAEYVGRFWPGIGEPYIRNAENDKTCPADIVGQQHNDGETFTAALWATRKRLTATGKEALDRAVLEALMRMASDIALEEAAALVLEQADLEVQEGNLHPDDWTLLQRSMEARGLLDCPRVITDPVLGPTDDGYVMYLRRVDSGIHPFYPAPTQLRYEVPPDADDMVVSFRLRPRNSEDPVEGVVLVKRGEAPIEYEYQLVAVDDPPLEPPEDGSGFEDPVRELVLVTGDWDLELTATEVTDERYLLELGGLEPGEVLHVTVVDKSPVDGTVSELVVRSSTALPEDESGGSSSGDGDSGSLPAVDRVAPGDGVAGCACRVERGAAGRAGAGPWALLLVLGLWRARRRRS